MVNEPEPGIRRTHGSLRISSPVSLGALVRRGRRERGWTQALLADQAGVGRRFIIELEAGKGTAAFGLVLRTLSALGLEVRIDRVAPGRAVKALNLDDVIDASS
jgi:y4mF family transcriptional regulator